MANEIGNLVLEASKPEPTTTKIQMVVDLLERSEGASIDELMLATGWQAHSIRGALAGAIKKRGHHVTSAKTDGVRRYRIEARS
ncbi:MAG: DUF3489 domain-containing protein [Alphaproteobacteria bacterium]|nr:DUF3489 domain-containing protein [Alphaproteobacteria bacterium]